MFLIILLILSFSQSEGFYKPTCEYSGLSCLDCYTQKNCINFIGLTNWGTAPCGNGITGEENVYCDPNTDKCTSKRPEGCESLSKYGCLRDGLFPDFKDCSNYYHCTGESTKDFACEDKYIYKQQYGKCVLKLSDDDCFKIPTCASDYYTKLYPGDESIYYGCIVSKSFIMACQESERYDLETETCKNLCDSSGNVPNSRKCSNYYECVSAADNSFNIIEKSCPEGQGYNPSTKKCDSNYKNLCNELYLLESDFYDLITFTPVIEKILTPIKSVLTYFNISPPSVLLLFGLDEQIVSDGILILDYIYKNKKIPISTIGIIIDVILPHLPESVQTILKTLMNMGIINFRSISARNFDFHNKDIDGYLYEILSETTIDIPGIINSFEGKNQEEISKMIFDEGIKLFQVPEYQIPFIVMMLRENMPMIANTLNQKLQMDLVIVREDAFRLNLQGIDALFNFCVDRLVMSMYPRNPFLGIIFKMMARSKYVVYYGRVSYFVENFYFTTNNLI